MHATLTNHLTNDIIKCMMPEWFINYSFIQFEKQSFNQLIIRLFMAHGLASKAQGEAAIPRSPLGNDPRSITRLIDEWFLNNGQFIDSRAGCSIIQRISTKN